LAADGYGSQRMATGNDPKEKLKGKRVTSSDAA
jgi:hypothetical protein